MSYLRDLNQKPSFWDWVSDMGGAAPEHPWPQAGQRAAGEGPSTEFADEKKQAEDTEMEPPEYDGEDPPSPPEQYPEDPFEPGNPEKLPDRSVQPPAEEGPGGDKPKHCHGRRGGRGCPRGRSGERGFPGHHGFPHHHGHHGWGGRGGPGGPGAGAGRRGGWGGRGRGGFGHPWAHGGGPPFGGPFGFAGGFGPQQHGEGMPQRWMEMAKKMAERFGIDPAQLGKGFGGQTTEEGVDFEPAIDVYSTPSTYVVHLALPGAKKEDVAVTYDENLSALNISGVVTRGVDEQMANQLALGERPVGFFKRIVRLGDRDHPAHVDAESITAKMEEGVLKITVGKVEEFVEVKKVQVD